MDNEESRIIICTPSQTARNTFFYLQDVGAFRLGTTVSTKNCNIESFLFGAIERGTGELVYNGENYTLAEGDCFLIDYRIPHICRSNEGTPLSVLWVRFCGATSEKYYEYFTTQSKNVFRPKCFERITSAINGIIYLNEQNSPNYEVLTSGLVVELLTIASIVETEENKVDSILRQKLTAINSYIENNFSDDITLELLAEKFYISKYYLTREYKKLYGRTIFQHLINCRINFGKKLLRFSDKSVDEIAHMCGFNDQSYFTRQFKRLENMTCFSYRRIWRD